MLDNRYFTVESSGAACIMPGMDHRIPVTVLTGFLGSGKTTLLNKLLRQPEMKNSAVVINEIGEAGLDHILARNVEDTYIADNTVLLGSGCLCCILRTELADTLRDLFFKRTLMAIPEFDRLIIETTGLADPGPILANLLNADVIREHYRLDAVVVTVDSVYGLEQLASHAEARRQAAVADVLLLTKSDLADAEKTTELSRSLQAINPGAAQHRIVYGDIAPDILIEAGLFDRTGQQSHPRRWLRPATTRHADISNFTIDLDQSLSWAALQPALQSLCKTHGDRLLRLKGIIHAADAPAPLAVHAVHHTLYPPTTLQGWQGDQIPSCLVVIGHDLNEAEIRALLTNTAERATHAHGIDHSLDGNMSLRST